MKKIAFIVSFLLLAPLAVAAETPPDLLVRETSDKITVLLKANRDVYAKDHKKLYAMVDENVLQHFDFRTMSKSVLARYWREATEDQRTKFAHEFRELLVRTYATALLKYTDQQILFLPFISKPDDKTVTVRTEVKQSGGGLNIPIHYSFFKSEAGWKVYDITIDGISLITNYRSTYAERIQREGLDALIASIARDNKGAAIDKGGSAQEPAALPQKAQLSGR